MHWRTDGREIRAQDTFPYARNNRKTGKLQRGFADMPVLVCRSGGICADSTTSTRGSPQVQYSLRNDRSEIEMNDPSFGVVGLIFCEEPGWP